MNTASLLKVLFNLKPTATPKVKSSSSTSRNFEQQLLSSSTTDSTVKGKSSEASKTNYYDIIIPTGKSESIAQPKQVLAGKKGSPQQDSEMTPAGTKAKETRTDGREVASTMVMPMISAAITPDKKSLVKTLLHMTSDKKAEVSTSGVTATQTDTKRDVPSAPSTFPASVVAPSGKSAVPVNQPVSGEKTTRAETKADSPKTNTVQSPSPSTVPAKSESATDRNAQSIAIKGTENRSAAATTVSADKIEPVARDTKSGTVAPAETPKAAATNASTTASDGVKERRIQDLWHSFMEPIKQTFSKEKAMPVLASVDPQPKVSPIAETNKQTQPVSVQVSAPAAKAEPVLVAAAVTTAAKVEQTPILPKAETVSTPKDSVGTETKSFWGMKVATVPNKSIPNPEAKEAAAQPNTTAKSTTAPATDSAHRKSDVSKSEPVFKTVSSTKEESSTIRPAITSEAPLEKKPVVFDSAKSETLPPNARTQAETITAKSVTQSPQARVADSLTATDTKAKSNSTLSDPPVRTQNRGSAETPVIPTEKKELTNSAQPIPRDQPKTSESAVREPVTRKNPAPVTSKTEPTVAAPEPRVTIRNEQNQKTERVAEQTAKTVNMPEKQPVSTTSSTIPADIRHTDSKGTDQPTNPVLTANPRTVKSRPTVTSSQTNTKPLVQPEPEVKATKPLFAENKPVERVTSRREPVRTEIPRADTVSSKAMPVTAAEQNRVMPQTDRTDVKSNPPVFDSTRNPVATGTPVRSSSTAATSTTTARTSDQTTNRPAESPIPKPVAPPTEPKPTTVSSATERPAMPVAPSSFTEPRSAADSRSTSVRPATEAARPVTPTQRTVNDQSNVKPSAPVTQETRVSTPMTSKTETRPVVESVSLQDRASAIRSEAKEQTVPQTTKTAATAKPIDQTTSSPSRTSHSIRPTIVAGEASRTAPAVFVDRTQFVSRDSVNRAADSSTSTHATAALVNPSREQQSTRNTVAASTAQDAKPITNAQTPSAAPQSLPNDKQTTQGSVVPPRNVDVKPTPAAQLPTTPAVEQPKDIRNVQNTTVPGNVAETKPLVSSPIPSSATVSPAKDPRDPTRPSAAATPVDTKPMYGSQTPSAVESIKARPPIKEDRVNGSSRPSVVTSPKESTPLTDSPVVQSSLRPADARAVSFIPNEVVKRTGEPERSSTTEGQSKESNESSDPLKNSNPQTSARVNSNVSGIAIPAVNTGQNGSGSTPHKQTSDSSAKATADRADGNVSYADPDVKPVSGRTERAKSPTETTGTPSETNSVRSSGKTNETASTATKAADATAGSQSSHAEQVGSGDLSATIQTKMNVDEVVHPMAAHSTLKFSAEQIRELQEMVSRAMQSSSSMQGSTPEAQFNWTSPEFGTLKFHISTRESDVSVQISSNNQDVVDTLEQSKAVVERLFTDQGLKIERFDIQCRTETTTQTNNGEQRFEGRSSTQDRNAERPGQGTMGTSSTVEREEPQPERRSFSGKREWVA